MPRKAKSISLHLVTGNRAHLTKDEIQKRKKAEQRLKPAADNIDRPEFLKHDKIAQREWRKIAPELERLGLLTNIDTTALAMYCQAVSMYVRLNAEIDKEGATIEYTNTQGATNVVENPKINIAKKYYQVIKDMLKEFGLTPAARASLAIKAHEDEEKEDPTAKFGV